MRAQLPAVWRNLVLFYLAVFLTLTAWGTTSIALRRRTWPAAGMRSEERASTLAESLGLWPAGRPPWRRLLELAIPGMSASHAKKLTRVPGGSPAWG